MINNIKQYFHDKIGNICTWFKGINFSELLQNMMLYVHIIIYCVVSAIFTNNYIMINMIIIDKIIASIRFIKTFI